MLNSNKCRIFAMTVQVGIQKWQAKKAGMVANYRLDAGAWSAGLSAAGAPPGPTRQANYSGSESYAKANYSAKINQATGQKWADKFIAAMAK
jgi:hypothetical protein